MKDYQYTTFLLSLFIKHVSEENKKSYGVTSDYLSETVRKLFENTSGRTMFESNASFQVFVKKINARNWDLSEAGQKKIEVNDDFYTKVDFITQYMFGCNFNDWKKQIDSLKNITTLEKIYYKKIYDFFDHEHQNKTVFEKIRDKYKIKDDELGWFLTTTPELIFNNIIRDQSSNSNDKYYGIDENQSQLMSSPIQFNAKPKNYDVSQNKIISNLTPTSIINNIDGIFIIHALSPNTDSLFLLLELGRFSRIASSIIYETEKRTKQKIVAKILCTDDVWSLHNKTVKDFEKTIEGNINFDKTIHLRRKVYNKLIQHINDDESFTFEFSSFADTTGKNQTKSKEEIDEEVKQYYKFSSSKPEFNQFNKIIHDVENANGFLENLNKYFSKEGDIDMNTIKYVLFQRYLQLNYNNYLKIGIRREFDFDTTFDHLNTELSTQHNIQHNIQHNLTGLYFKDYYVYSKIDKKSIKAKLHPYFFPSGDFLKKHIGDKNIFDGFFKKNGDAYIAKQNQFDQFISGMEKDVILLSDTRDYNKINRIINKYHIRELSTIISDLLCFIYYYFDKDFAYSIISNIDLGEEFNQVWEESYDTNNKRKNIYSDHIKSSVKASYNATKLPFYFYPYLFSMNTDKELAESYKKEYSKLIHITLKELSKD